MGEYSKYILDDFQKVLFQYYKPAVEHTRQLLVSHQFQYEELTVSEAESIFLVEDVFAFCFGIKSVIKNTASLARFVNQLSKMISDL